MRMVRRGLTFSAFRMRITSSATIEPAPLSVAPVPAIQLSRWPPTMTTSSFSLGSVPGISATVLKPCSWSPVNLVSTFISIDDRHVVLEQAEDAAVALDLRHDDGKWNGGVAMIRSAAEGRAVVVEDDAGTAAVFAVAAGDDDAGDFFFGEERKDLVA